MGLNETPSAERLHIGFFGMRNAGKSSLVNAITGQELSIVSDVKGTTTDPVRKSMELLPLGPVVIIDTPGLDDEGMLGEMRVKKAKQVLNFADVAVLVVDAALGMQSADTELLETIKSKKVPYIIAYNKADTVENIQGFESPDSIIVSAKDGLNINELKERIGAIVKTDAESRRIVSDLISPEDNIVLVVPIDKAAPKGRLILPQQQTIRDILDAGATVTVCRDTELASTLELMKNPPRMVITDSQAFGKVSAIVPKDVLLTSFSILFARYKGNLLESVRGVAALDRLCDNDKILISEGCTHHRQCGDIGTVKLPAWIKKYTGKSVQIDFTSGKDFPEELGEYKLIIHCGGCMLTEREMQYRAREASDSGVPMTNYGMVIAHTHGILKRSLEVFPEILDELK